MKNFTLLIMMLAIIISCKKETTAQPPIQSNVSIPLTYASSFRLDSTDNALTYTIINNGMEKKITIHYDQLPFENVVTTSASAVAYLDALDEVDKIKGAYDTNWIYNENLHRQVENKETQDLGNSNGMELEQLLQLNPDAVMVFSDPNKTQLYDQLEENGIQIIYVDEYLDQTPLGRTEYLKFYGLLTGKYEQANELFNQIEKDYTTLKEKVNSVEHKPTILANVMRGDIWYLPGGKSFSAQFFADAGGDYLWKEDTTEGSINLDFEQVYDKAKDAEFWLNASDYKTISQLNDAHKNHRWFQAYKEGNVYSFAKRTNENGANDFFETGTVRPDLVLKDLISILHPEVLPDHELYFYQKLE
ncbi:ABC transporter substrate-binding protein [Flavobacteriaceae bacterium Ap0902]|nr:ABC transporter substrate-binding protein [Flavobacteriaceae bacterium Ap0902]